MTFFTNKVKEEIIKIKLISSIFFSFRYLINVKDKIKKVIATVSTSGEPIKLSITPF